MIWKKDNPTMRLSILLAFLLLGLIVVSDAGLRRRQEKVGNDDNEDFKLGETTFKNWWNEFENSMRGWLWTNKRTAKDAAKSLKKTFD